MSHDPVRIALIGNPGSGKSSIAKELCRLTGARPLSFAEYLRHELATALGQDYAIRGTLPPSEHGKRMTDPATKDAYRPLLQAWGAFRRQEQPDYWLRRVEDRIFNGRGYVIDDARYDNEHAALARLGFKFVALDGGAYMRPLRGTEAEHESERNWPQWDPYLYLSYREGVSHQAYRIILALGLSVNEVGAAEIAEHLGDVALGGVA